MNDMLPVLRNVMETKNLSKDGRRWICSQLEALTDMYYASKHELMELSMIDQSRYVEAFKLINTYRQFFLSTAEFSLVNNTFAFQSIRPPSSMSTPKTSIQFRPSRFATSTNFSNIQPIPATSFAASVSQQSQNVNDHHMSVDPTKVNLEDFPNDNEETMKPNVPRQESFIPVSSTCAVTCQNSTQPQVVFSSSPTTNQNPMTSQNIPMTSQNQTMTSQNPTTVTYSYPRPISSSSMQRNSFNETYFTADNTQGRDDFIPHNAQYRNYTHNATENANVYYPNNVGTNAYQPQQNNFGAAAYQPSKRNNFGTASFQPPQSNNFGGFASNSNVNYPQNSGTNSASTSFIPPTPTNMAQFNFQDFWDAFFNSSQRMASGNSASPYLPKLNDWHPKFNGSNEYALEHVLIQWENLAGNCRMSPEVLLSNVHLLLRGQALSWHNAIGVDYHSWDAYKVAIIDRFQAPDKIVVTFMSVANEQKKEEKFDIYFARLRMLMKQARGEISERQLATRLLTGLRDTRCRDIVRNNTFSMDVNWNKIIRDINQVEIEYDLISHAHRMENSRTSDSKPKDADWRVNTKSYPPKQPFNDKFKFASKSPYFNKSDSKSNATIKKDDDKKDFAKDSKFSKNWPWKGGSSKKSVEQSKVESCAMINIPDYIDVSDELRDDIENNREMLMSIFEDNNWTEENIEFFMYSSTCSNCDQKGHILENCDLVVHENKFRPQCLQCHSLDVDTDSCCRKN